MKNIDEPGRILWQATCTGLSWPPIPEWTWPWFRKGDDVVSFPVFVYEPAPGQIVKLSINLVQGGQLNSGIGRQAYVTGRAIAGSPNCGTNFCTFYLPTVPADKRLVITDFYGTVSMETTAALPMPTVHSLRLFAVLNSPPWTRTADFEVPPNPSAYYNVALTYQLRRYPFREKVQMYVEAGLTPVIDFWTGSGYLNPDFGKIRQVISPQLPRL